MRSLFLNILLGISVVCGNYSANGSDSQGGAGRPAPGGAGGSRPPPSWFLRWTSIEDANKYSEFLDKYGPDDVRINERVIEETAKGFGIRRDANGRWIIDANVNDSQKLEALCVFTSALYSIGGRIALWYDDIFGIIKVIIEECSPVFIGGQSFSGRITLQNYMIRWAALLVMSQTENLEGEEWKDNCKTYPISIAKELLEQQKSRMKEIAGAMLSKIDAIPKKVKVMDEF
jgi:hypothetical protein